MNHNAVFMRMCISMVAGVVAWEMMRRVYGLSFEEMLGIGFLGLFIGALIVSLGPIITRRAK